MKPYVVRQGDHLAKLAHLMRFDVDEVWNHPKNEALKALRSPTLLCPGDILFVPDRAPTPLPLRAGTKNRYVAKVPKVRLRLGFKDEAGAYRSEPYRVEGLNAVVEGETDAEGVITIAVPVMVRELSVVFPKRGVRHPIYLGDMDPVSEATGLRKRLVNLGYYKHAGGDGESTDDQEVWARDALARFQKDHGLDPSGEPNDETRRALVEAHGC